MTEGVEDALLARGTDSRDASAIIAGYGSRLRIVEFDR
jgi:hypothetical protein